MENWYNFFLITLMLTNFMLLGSSRIRSCIRIFAFQGVVLGLLPILGGGAISVRVVWIALASMALKGALFPWYLSRAVRKAEVSREVEPFVGFNASILTGVLLLAVSFWLGSRLPLPAEAGSALLVPVAFFNILAGLFFIISRKKAVMQVMGYMGLENGVYVFGVALALETPLLVELGILLDVFVAVFVMGIVIFHINRTFDHIDTHKLSRLRG